VGVGTRLGGVRGEFQPEHRSGFSFNEIIIIITIIVVVVVVVVIVVLFKSVRLGCGQTIAGFAFDVYNKPPIGKLATGVDRTTIIFTSVSFIRHMFARVVMVNLLSAEFRAENAKE